MLDETLRQSFTGVDLTRLRTQFPGGQYRHLVQRHMRKLGRKLELSITAAVLASSDLERRVSERLVDEFNTMGYDQAFWRRDCGEVLQHICERFEEEMHAAGGEADDTSKFIIIQLITLNFASMARDQKALRQFAGIRKGWLCR